MRGLLRHVRLHVDNKAGFPLRTDTSLWRQFIVQQYRDHQHDKDRAAVRRLRQAAAEALDGFEAVVAQQELFFRYGGVDQDSTEYRTAAAHRVGLAIPEQVPIREFDKSKYNIAAAVNFADAGLSRATAKFMDRKSGAESVSLGNDAAAGVLGGSGDDDSVSSSKS